mmetsp:Transcript_6203/g.13688  ORF Transcript_6203/g.13688 Transcript_6203/m.13688 type:complete len:288 (-) Transcript_6203:72-935(-)
MSSRRQRRSKKPPQTAQAAGQHSAGLEVVPAPSCPEDPRMWQTVLALTERLRARRLLSTSWGGWRRMVEVSHQVKREALFDSLAGQLAQAKRTEHVFETRCLQLWQEAICFASFRAWQSTAQDARARTVPLLASAFASWRHWFHSVADGNDAEQVALDEASSVALTTANRRTRRASTSEFRSARESQLGRKTSHHAAEDSPEAGRKSPLREGGHPNVTKKPIRGPEKFFYDRSGYTGCARFGGPSVIDKENLPVMPQNLRGGSTCASSPVEESRPAFMAKRQVSLVR